ncbi:MAG: penicillin acylase family protein [Actinobacteria bacterium]|nr:penicillin acylase family protein [Actinomycetota bacterium]MCG2794403.1 penicillin acylase family protein [Actinomycetes bacterium]
MRKAGKLLGLGVPAAFFGGAGYLATRLRMSMPRTGGKMRLPCLEEDVEVVFDRAGIPHVTARNDSDAYRALGYVMAQDRMVQMESMLRVAQGRLSEVVGTMAVDVDRFMRTIGIGRIGRDLVGSLEPESLDCLQSFCDGINCYLSRGRARLPFEFMLMRGRPEPWVPANCLTLGLFYTWLLDSFWLADLVREKLIRSIGMERAMELLPCTTDYNNPPVKVDGPGPDAATLEPGEEIDWDFGGESGGGEWLAGMTHRSVFGSNNWVVSGALTDTGKPILAGDPHIQHNVPGVLYLCHLTTPGQDVIGATFPGLPVIAYGHNGYCGWTATSLCPDTQDLYVETFESEGSNRYRFKGEWLEAEVIDEEVKVRFSRPRVLKILVTRHGPVIKRKGDKGLALKWVSGNVALDSLQAMIKQNRARSWDEFTGAMEDFVGPALSQVYADVDGNIGYLAAVKIPRRATGDGTVPVRGEDGEGEWEGYVPFDRMPRALNPEEGFIVTANSKVVSEGYPELITRAWEAPYRNGRISQLLREKEKWSLEEMAAIHGDAFTFPGKRFAEAAVSAAPGEELSPEATEAVRRLEEWDHQARADSVAMTIYFYSWDRLREKLLRHRLGSTLYREYTQGWTTVNLAIENLIQSGDGYWLPPGCPSYDRLVIDSLEEGVLELARVFETKDQSSWKWGRVHHLTCQHLLGLFWPLDKLLNVGPVPRDGEGDTVNASPPSSDYLTQLLARGTMGGCADLEILPDPESHVAYAGPVLRLLIDFNDLDNSRAVLDVGQSGHRLSPHYKDHFPHWYKVEYLPLPYTRAKVAEEAAGTLLLTP